MIHLKKFNEDREIFIEFMLEYETTNGLETLSNYRLMYIIKFTKRNNLKNYTIKGFRGGQWEVIINKKVTNK
jgi:hypothetical protein